MAITFYKYQGTGNDFIMIDNRSLLFDKNNTRRIALLCDRRFGIGADGLILLENHDTLDFKMVYYNSDGNESSMCGNGGRCITAFAKFLGLIDTTTAFEAIDGVHEAVVENDVVRLKMNDVETIQVFETHLFLNTGSPHHVQLEANLESLDVKTKGAAIRYGEPYGQSGSNVNFVRKLDTTTFKVRTYERGVEDETLSCGTGVTAVAIAMHASGETNANSVNLETPGGTLTVTFDKKEEGYTNIWLIGKATQVFKGTI
ncbi:MAG TPA: diaminopimelate epimerase [Mangrovimonas sp.]|nr:diaminopimelate epimerase [Mangrovimonas sp.]